MKSTFSYPKMGACISELMARLKITERFFKGELSVGSRAYSALKKAMTSA
ncbi:hypothetical protein [uncultured Parabacteroides sp.]|nr:hypothetical protein [uncultured Parabacteroides sp.]